MGKSLHEQLLKAGLVDKGQVRRAKKQKHAQSKHAKPQAPNSAIQQAQQEQAKKDRALNLEQQHRQEEKAVVAQIRQLIEAHEQSCDGGQISYHFVDAPHVRKIYVTQIQQQQLINGQLVLVKYAQRYALVPETIATKIRQRDAHCVLERAKADPVDEAYAQYEIPDDLMW